MKKNPNFNEKLAEAIADLEARQEAARFNKEKIMTAVCDVCHWPYVYEDEETMKEEKCDCCPVEEVMEPMRAPTGEEDYW